MTKYALLGALALCVVSFQACKKSNYIELSDEDLSWIIYRNSDSISFVANAGFKIHFVAYNHSRYYVHDGDNYYEGATILLNLPSADEKDEGLINVQKLSDGSSSVTMSWPHFNGSVDLANTVPVTATVNGKVYKDLYIATSVNTTNHLFIKKIYYSRSAGMIRLEDRFGYTYSRIN